MLFKKKDNLIVMMYWGNTSLINAVNTSSSNSGNSCTYCGKDNHIVDRCFKKNGFPHNYASRGRRQNQADFGRRHLAGRGSKLCIHYGLTSHTIDECYRSMVILLDKSLTSIGVQTSTISVMLKKKVIAQLKKEIKKHKIRM